ncbi:MAG: NUDIX domain-containing protein [Patescibacteria group bacterium]
MDIVTSDRYKLIASVYLLFVKNDKILLLLRANTGYEDGKYGLVAGHLESGESLTNGAIREAKEESGVVIEPSDLVLRATMHRRQFDERLDFFFEVKKWSGELRNAEPDKCDDLSWFPLDDLPANTIPYIRQAIDCYRKDIGYSEFGW